MLQKYHSITVFIAVLCLPTGVGGGCGRDICLGRRSGRERGQRDCKRTVQRATSPYNDAQYAPSTSKQADKQTKKKYRLFRKDSSRFKDTLTEQAAKACIEAKTSKQDHRGCRGGHRCNCQQQLGHGKGRIKTSHWRLLAFMPEHAHHLLSCQSVGRYPLHVTALWTYMQRSKLK